MEAELLAAKGHIAHLQTQLASSHTTSKRARIEIEKKLDAIKYEKEVRRNHFGRKQHSKKKM